MEVSEMTALQRIARNRGYHIGERNPATLPGQNVTNESVHANDVASRRWRALRKSVQSGAMTGIKYV